MSMHNKENYLNLNCRNKDEKQQEKDSNGQLLFLSFWSIQFNIYSSLSWKTKYISTISVQPGYNSFHHFGLDPFETLTVMLCRSLISVTLIREGAKVKIKLNQQPHSEAEL